MLKKLIFAFSLGLIVVLVISFTLPSTYYVQRTTVIQASPLEVFAYVNEMKRWPVWSIWMERDPAMTYSFGKVSAGVGANMKWKSKSQGEGEITFKEVVPNEAITYELRFTDWESVSTGKFKLAATSGGTEVTWSDEGKLSVNPVMKIMGRFFDKWIGEDFEAGLKKLKEAVEQKK